MPIGNSIQEGTAQILSTTGVVYAFDLSNQNIETMQRAVIYDDETNASQTITEDSGVTAILKMPFSTSAPSFAWAQSGHTIYIFIKTAIYAADVHTRIAFWMKATAPLMTSLDGTLSIPPVARGLLTALIDEEEGEGQPNYFQSEGVRRARAELGV